VKQLVGERGRATPERTANRWGTERGYCVVMGQKAFQASVTAPTRTFTRGALARPADEAGQNKVEFADSRSSTSCSRDLIWIIACPWRITKSGQIPGVLEVLVGCLGA
jgi:hypothetical protein